MGNEFSRSESIPCLEGTKTVAKNQRELFKTTELLPTMNRKCVASPVTR
jgi:hypothetical protein